jgi:uroporphyrinogen decarboxylase
LSGLKNKKNIMNDFQIPPLGARGLKNDLFLRALKGETVERPPVWMMRQAGRYLPEFRALRDKYDFFTRCETPELAAEITVQPIRIVKPDAAILFSDILVVPRAMGIHVELKDNLGPIIPNPIRTSQDVEKVFVPDVNETLGYVFDAIKLTKEMLDNEVPLIGFAGSPWTIFCYAVEGKGSKSFDTAKGFCFSNPVAAHIFITKNHRYHDFIFKRKSKIRCKCGSNI